MGKATRSTAFADWIDKITPEKLADALGVHVFTVRRWRRGAGDPRVDHMRQIKFMTRGQIGYDEIIDRDVFTSHFQRELRDQAH